MVLYLLVGRCWYASYYILPPQANGFLDRYHGTLKSSLLARLADCNWYSHLPWVMLSLLTTPEDNLGSLPADLALHHSILFLACIVSPSSPSHVPFLTVVCHHCVPDAGSFFPPMVLNDVQHMFSCVCHMWWSWPPVQQCPYCGHFMLISCDGEKDVSADWLKLVCMPLSDSVCSGVAFCTRSGCTVKHQSRFLW